MTRVAGLLFLAMPAVAALLPVPASVVSRPGRMLPGSTFRIVIEGADDGRVARAAERTERRMGAHPGSGSAILRVRVAQLSGDDESYRLHVDPAGALLTAPTPLGALHGIETFYQLMEGGAVPSVEIEDHPRFAWRGLLLDSARHFMPPDLIRRTLDGMAAVKLNVFHWHLSDDQGFRVESRRFPKLHELGSKGLYYTQDEVREIVLYARDRGIRVVPEFDMPGHTTSWLVGYPELGSGPGPYQLWQEWGITDPTLDPAKSGVYDFLDAFLGEMAGLFPDPYFHIGGDEVNGHEWSANTTDIPAFMREHEIKTNDGLQAYFNQRVQQILTKYGKRMVGWDEILNPALPKDVVIQSWRGPKGLGDAARAGFAGILSWGYYLDHMDSAAKMYGVDPGQNARVLGGEVCMWTEYVTPENVEGRIWPRAAAVAERLWSPAAVNNVPDLYRRLNAIEDELSALGIPYRRNYDAMLGRLATGADLAALRTLAEVTTAGELAVRHHANPNYQQSTPLDRFPDAVLPESVTARQFSERVDRWLAHRNASDLAQIRVWLNRWIANDVLIQKMPGVPEAKAVSAVLAEISRAALGGQASPALTAALKPIGEVHLAVAPAIERFAKQSPSRSSRGPRPVR
jgi:hexosaminidase